MSLARFKLVLKVLSLGFIVIGVFTTISPFVTGKNISREEKPIEASTVLGIASYPTPTPVAVLPDGARPSIAPHEAPIVTPHIGHPTKSSYSIAVYGDSLEDTMGDRLELLSANLGGLYPTIHFSLYNYGIGAQNIAEGLDRFDNVLTYKGRNYPPISVVKPDIIVVGSFAYNPFSPSDPSRHKALLTQLVQKAKSTGAKVFLLAETAPLGIDFAKGPSGMTGWTDDFRLSHAKEIIDQMTNVFSVAYETATPLIDVYDKTKSNGPFGSWQFIGSSDGIHPSEKGQEITADAIAHSIF